MKYYQVQNGQQIDIHYREYPLDAEPRERVLISDLKQEQCATLLPLLNRIEDLQGVLVMCEQAMIGKVSPRHAIWQAIGVVKEPHRVYQTGA